MARLTPAISRYLDLLDQLCAEGRASTAAPDHRQQSALQRVYPADPAAKRSL